MRIFLVLALAPILLAGCADQSAQDDFSLLEQKLDAIEESVDELEKDLEEPSPEVLKNPRFTSPDFDSNESSWSPAEIHSMNQLYKELEALSEELDEQEKKMREREEILENAKRDLDRDDPDLERRQKELKQRIQDYVADFERVSASEEKNLKKLSSTFVELSPAGAVALIKQYEKDGQLDKVIKILEFLKPGEIAPIFDEMMKEDDDESTKLVETITGRLRVIHHEPISTP